MKGGSEPILEGTLLQIKRKEIELQTLLLAARREAEEVVAAARDEAALLRLEASAAADAEARSLRAAELEGARREADRIRRAFEERVSLLGSGEDVLSELSERIRNAVAPQPN